MPPGALSFEAVLFLDFDGVLHPEGCSPSDEFCFCGNFCEILRRVDPQGLMPIVISSMWRHDTSVPALRAFFPTDISRRIVGVTPNIPSQPLCGWELSAMTQKGRRQREVEAWLAEFAPAARWLAVDDRAMGFDDGCPHLFLVPTGPDSGGLTPLEGAKLQVRLGEFLVG